ncbi:hypothetical protein IID27_02010 [Patescibacteria group bacterium]|nr:hypothetical protein [Patescibacteria group bacterium]
MNLRRIHKRIKSFFVQSSKTEIDPDEIFLDSSNLPDFNTSQFEGRIEKPISKKIIMLLGGAFFLVFVVMTMQLWMLQVVKGEEYTIQSESNRLQHSIIFSDRGIIYDRKGTELTWNTPYGTEDFAHRSYVDMPGFAHTLGYVSYPLKDSKGIYYQEEFIGTTGVEKFFNDKLKGIHGVKIVETNAVGIVQSESVIRPPQNGRNITLSIDAAVQSSFYNAIRDIAESSGFVGGAGVIMDVENGEILAMASFPQYDSSILSDGKRVAEITAYISDDRKPFLNRVTTGLYTPGSIIKPYIAIGALNEKIIDPETKILSTGSISIPNPFFPDQVSVFNDWKALGYVDMRDAIAFSSNIYFFEVGGGYGEQEGLGIENIEKYVRLFGIGEKSNINIPAEVEGVIPSPQWKEEHFEGDIWRIGDTYNTAIGQYGFQVTPIQMVRAVAALATGGKLLEPTVLRGDTAGARVQIDVPREHFEIVKEGMRRAVTIGIAQGLSFPDLDIAAKTGTAEVGAGKQFINSWVTGFFPYEKPQYAFVVIMERASKGTLIGSVMVARKLFEWMLIYTPEYLK